MDNGHHTGRSFDVKLLFRQGLIIMLKGAPAGSSWRISIAESIAFDCESKRADVETSAWGMVALLWGVNEADRANQRPQNLLKYQHSRSSPSTALEVSKLMETCSRGRYILTSGRSDDLAIVYFALRIPICHCLTQRFSLSISQ